MDEWIKRTFAWVAGAGVLFGPGVFHDFERAAAHELASRLQGSRAQVRLTSVSNGLFGVLVGNFSSAKIEARDFESQGLPIRVEKRRNQSGRIGTLRIELRDFSIRSLEIESFLAEVTGCRFDLKLAVKKRIVRLSRAGNGRGRVIVDENSLSRFLMAKFSEIRSVNVKCDRGWIWIEGRGEFLFVESNFRVLGQLATSDGTSIELTRPRIAFNGLPVDGPAAEAVMAILNPILDLNKDLMLEGAMNVKSILTEAGKLTAEGVVTIPEGSN